jgi:hypothetical protein
MTDTGGTPPTLPVRVDDLTHLHNAATLAALAGLLGECTEDPCPICSALEAAYMMLRRAHAPGVVTDDFPAHRFIPAELTNLRLLLAAAEQAVIRDGGGLESYHAVGLVAPLGAVRALTRILQGILAYTPPPAPPEGTPTP